MVVHSIQKLGSSSLLSTSIRKLSSSVGTPENTPEQEKDVTDEREEVKGDEEVRETSADRENDEGAQSSPAPSSQPVNETLAILEWQSVLQSPTSEEKSVKETTITPKVHPNWERHHSSLQTVPLDDVASVQESSKSPKVHPNWEEHHSSANEAASVQGTTASTPKVHPNWARHHSVPVAANEEASVQEEAVKSSKVHPNWAKHHSSRQVSFGEEKSVQETVKSSKVHPNWAKHHSSRQLSAHNEPVVQQSKAVTEALNVEPSPEETVDIEVSDISGTDYNCATKSVSSKESKVSKFRSMMRLSKSKSSKSSSSVKSNDMPDVEGAPSKPPMTIESVADGVEGGERVSSIEGSFDESKRVQKVGDLKIQVFDDGAECTQNVDQEMSMTQSTATGVSYSFRDDGRSNVDQEMSMTQSTATGVSYSFRDDGRSAEEPSSFKCSSIFSDLSNMCHRVEVWTDITLTQLSEGLCNKSESERVAVDEIPAEEKDAMIEERTSVDHNEGCVSEETKSQVANSAEFGAAQCKTSALELGAMCQQLGASSIGWMSQVSLKLCNKNEVEKAADHDETSQVVKEGGIISESDKPVGATAAGLLGTSIMAIGCISLCNKSEAEKVASDEILPVVKEEDNVKAEESHTMVESEAVQSVANDVVSALEVALEGDSVKQEAGMEEPKSTSLDTSDKDGNYMTGNTQASVKSMAESIFNALKGTPEAETAGIDTNQSIESVLSAETEPRRISVVQSPPQLAAVTEGSDRDSCKACEAGGNAFDAAFDESNGDANVKEATSVEDRTPSNTSRGKVACGIAACAGIAVCGAMANTKSIEEESDTAQAVHGEESVEQSQKYAGEVENEKDDADLLHENQDVSQALAKPDELGKETIGKALLDSILFKLAKSEVAAKSDGNSTNKQVKIHLLRSKLLHLTHREDKWADQLNGESSVPDDVFVQGPLEKLVSPALAMIDRAMLAGDTGCIIGTADIIDQQCVDHHNVNSSATDSVSGGHSNEAVFTA